MKTTSIRIKTTVVISLIVLSSAVLSYSFVTYFIFGNNVSAMLVIPAVVILSLLLMGSRIGKRIN